VPDPIPPIAQIGGRRIQMVALPRCAQPRRGQILP